MPNKRGDSTDIEIFYEKAITHPLFEENLFFYIGVDSSNVSHKNRETFVYVQHKISKQLMQIGVAYSNSASFKGHTAIANEIIAKFANKEDIFDGYRVNDKDIILNNIYVR